MSWIKARDPLALVAIQNGLIGTPTDESAATGGGSICTQQRAVQLGEPVPIVFGRRRGGAGGVFISPGATEARFENDVSNAVTAFYHLVLSEGRVDDIAVKDVFQCSCRVGSHTQTYNRRAGSWVPGNFIVERDGYDKPECPHHCGSVGSYPRMSTMSFRNTVPDGFDFWNRQVHVFIRGGMNVTRLYDDTIGPSDNFADLVLWMLTNKRRVPDSIINSTALGKAATFLEANDFTCNCWLTESRNYGDLLAQWAPYFLLCESNSEGKRGLRPLLPTNANGTINTGAIDWEYIFTEENILPGSLEIEYTSLADRVPFVAQVTWRQELGDDAPIIRTSEVRYAGTPVTGPYESHDLSAFCTRENHAVKVGAYILAKRTYTTHTIRFATTPQAHNRLIEPGDIVRVKVARQASGSSPSYHDYLYQVERITKTLAGDVSYECVHFPVDDQGRSLIAKDVVEATGSGILFESNWTGPSCDENDPEDETIPEEEFTDPPPDPDPEVTIPEVGIPNDSETGGSPGTGGGSGPNDDSENPDDDKDPSPDSPYDRWPDGYPTPDDPNWPAPIPPNPTPGPDPYIEPSTTDPIPAPAAGETTLCQLISVGSVTYRSYGSSCTVLSSPNTTSAAKLYISYQKAVTEGKGWVTGAFNESGYEGTCGKGGRTYYKTWLVRSTGQYGTIYSNSYGGGYGLIADFPSIDISVVTRDEALAMGATSL